MKRNLLKIAVVFAMVLIMSGCKNTLQKSHEFVNEYNMSAPMVTNQVITSTSAKVLPDNVIELTFVSGMSPDPSNNSIYEQMLPTMIVSLLKSQESTSDLINEGVTFDVEFQANDGSKLAGMRVDKKKFDELVKESSKPKKAGGIDYGNATTSPKLKEMLPVLNQSLPIIDKEAGTKITKIDVSEKNELTYHVECDDKLAALLANEEASALMKEEVLRSADLRKILSGVRAYNVTTLKYLYRDSKGKVLSEITIDESDL